MSSPSFDVNEDIILKAGAGAGKTTTLINVFVQYAKQFKQIHGRYPKLVITTFTRKATQEIRERLLQKALQNNDQELFEYIGNKSFVHISTIHGVLSIFLSRYGAIYGMTPDFRILTGTEQKNELRKLLKKHLFDSSDWQNLLEEYDFNQIEEMLLCYFEASVQYSELNFMSRDEMAALNQKSVDQTSLRATDICQNILSETDHPQWIEYISHWKKITTIEQFRSVIQIKKPIFSKKKPPFSEELNDQFEEIRSEIKKMAAQYGLSEEFLYRHQKNCEQFQALANVIVQDLVKLKIENGIITMSDLEIISYKIIKENASAAQSFSQEWDYWMVDEYQDTSPIQVELLKSFIGNRKSFTVGDPQQSIYLFRGARSEVFFDKINEIKEKGGVVELAMTNYRSSPSLLHFFNYYFSKMSSQFSPMIPHLKNETKRNDLPVAHIIITPTINEDNEFIQEQTTIARIQSLLKEGISPEQICVLSRTHKILESIAHLSQEIGLPIQLHSSSGFYERREIKDLIAMVKFLINPHDNHNFVSLLRAPWFYISDNEISTFCHYHNHSFWSEAIKTLSAQSEAHPLRRLVSYLQEFTVFGVVYTLKKMITETGMIDTSHLVDSSGRREANIWKFIFLLADEEKKPGFNYLHFFNNVVDRIDVENGSGDSDATPVIEPRRVNLMTIHASKGLQFEHIILPSMETESPTMRAQSWMMSEFTKKWTMLIRDEETSKYSRSALASELIEQFERREGEEFDRLLYVALTRAKSGVTLIWDEKVKQQSWAARCPLNLQEGIHQVECFSYSVQYAHFIPEKMEKEKLKASCMRESLSLPLSIIPKQKRQLSVTEVIGEYFLKSQLSSTLGAEKSFNNKNILKDLSAAQNGTYAHRIFEAIKYQKQDDLNAYLSNDLKNAVSFVLNCIELPLKNIIYQGEVEWGFSVEGEGREWSKFVKQNEEPFILQGQIDLWAYLENTLYVVDYKTGSEKYSDLAFAQMELYVIALKKIYELKPQKTIIAAVYPFQKNVKTREF